MPTSRPRDHLGRLSRLIDGIRHDARLFSDSSEIGTRRERVLTITTPPMMYETTSREPSRIANLVTLIDVKSVVIINTNDIIKRMETIMPETMFNHKLFTHGPRTSRSLHNKSRNTVALGSSTPANACTLVVIRPKGAPGMMTSPA